MYIEYGLHPNTNTPDTAAPDTSRMFRAGWIPASAGMTEVA